MGQKKQESLSWYEEEKIKIIDEYGMPQFSPPAFYDGYGNLGTGGEPMNEAAKKILELNQVAADRGIEIRNKKNLRKAFNDIEKRKRKDLKLPNQMSVDAEIPPELLVIFQERDKKIAEVYFSLNQPTVRQIVDKLGEDWAHVYHLINTDAFKKLESQMCQVLKERLPLKAWRSIDRVLSSESVEPVVMNAAKAILEDAGQLKSQIDTQINLYTPPKIDDPQAEEKLRLLGKELANSSEIEQTDTVQ